MIEPVCLSTNSKAYLWYLQWKPLRFVRPSTNDGKEHLSIFKITLKPFAGGGIPMRGKRPPLFHSLLGFWLSPMRPFAFFRNAPRVSTREPWFSHWSWTKDQ